MKRCRSKRVTRSGAATPSVIVEMSNFCIDVAVSPLMNTSSQSLSANAGFTPPHCRRKAVDEVLTTPRQEGSQGLDMLNQSFPFSSSSSFLSILDWC